jgi:hypothetical protein
MTGTACCAVRRRRRTAGRQHRARRGLSEARDRRVSEPVKPCELRVHGYTSTYVSKLISDDMYLRVCLDDCLPPRCVWLFSVGPEEIVLLVGGSRLLLCLGSCLGASSSALRLCDRRGRDGGRHGGQCRWMCGSLAIEVEQQLQAVVWCLRRRDDGAPSTWNVLNRQNRHTWPKPHQPFNLWTLLPRRSTICCGQARANGRDSANLKSRGVAKREVNLVSLVLTDQIREIVKSQKTSEVAA